jgi:hypothetical protein
MWSLNESVRKSTTVATCRFGMEEVDCPKTPTRDLRVFPPLEPQNGDVVLLIFRYSQPRRVRFHDEQAAPRVNTDHNPHLFADDNGPAITRRRFIKMLDGI